MHPDVVRGIVPVSMPHPLDLKRTAFSDTLLRRAVSYSLSFQLPFWPEYQLRKNDAAKIGEILRDWSGSEWPDQETENVFRAAMLGHASPHCALEYHRWAFRSILRTDGRRFNRYMKRQVAAPILQIHGARDGSISPRPADAEHYSGTFEWCELENVGHFPHEEAAEGFNKVVLEWLQKI